MKNNNKEENFDGNCAYISIFLNGKLLDKIEGKNYGFSTSISSSLIIVPFSTNTSMQIDEIGEHKVELKICCEGKKIKKIKKIKIK